MRDVTLKAQHVLPRHDEARADSRENLAEVRVYEVGYLGTAFGLEVGPDDYLVEIGAAQAVRFARYDDTCPAEWTELEQRGDLEAALRLHWECAMDIYEGRLELDRYNRGER
jgi:hypothetical protein